MKVKEEYLPSAISSRLPDLSALMSQKLMSSSTLSLSALVEGSDAERAEKTRLFTLQLSKCHHSERFNLDLDAEVFCNLIRSASGPLLVKVCELLNAYIKAVLIDMNVVDNIEGIGSAGDLYAFYHKLHDDLVMFVLPNMKAADLCTLFICNLLSICSSSKIFVSIIEDFGRSIESLLYLSDDNDSSIELSADRARQVIGIMKALLSLTKAFGAPPAPVKQLCNIASKVIKSTRIHLCRLYSYNVIAFLLRKLNSEDTIKENLPTLTAPQIKQVIALLKEANHLKDTYVWSFQHKAISPVQQHATISAVTNNCESTQSHSARVQCASSELMHSKPAECSTTAIMGLDASDIRVHDKPVTAVTRNTSDNDIVSSSDTAKVTMGKQSCHNDCMGTTETSDVLTAPEGSSALPFKPEWARMLVAQFVDCRHGSKASEYNREAWKAKLVVLSNVVEQVEHIPVMLNIGSCTAPLISVIENVLQYESAIPIIQSCLRLLYLLLSKSENNISRTGKAYHMFELVYERLKDSNNKVQTISIWCVASIITRSGASANVDLIKKMLMHKSPLARITMCSIIAGSTALPENACNISRDLQGVKAQLIPLIDLLLADKNIKVRNAAIDCKRALEDPTSVTAKIAVDAPVPRVTPRKPLTGQCTQPVRHGNQNISINSSAVEEPSAANKPAMDFYQSSGSANILSSKRRLVRRFLKHSGSKHSKVNSGETKCPLGEASCDVTDDAPVDSVVSGVNNAMTLPSALPLEEPMHVSDNKTDCSTVVAANPRIKDRTVKVKKSAVEGTRTSTLPTSSCQKLTDMPSNTERSPYEEALLLHVPVDILNKVAKRGEFRRSLPQGLYELWAWMQEHPDITAGIELQILLFIRECTNNFREHSKSVNTAVWTFLEDFSSMNLSVETVELLVASLVSNISNMKAATIVRLLLPRCDLNNLITKVLDGSLDDHLTEVLSATLEFLVDSISTAGVSNLKSSTIDALLKYCSPLMDNDNTDVAVQCQRLMDVLNAVPMNCHTPELTKSHSQSPLKPLVSQTSEDTKGSNMENTVLSCLFIPAKLQNMMEKAFVRLHKAISEDLYECMSQSQTINQACQFWDNYLLQPNDKVCSLLFGADNIRLELLVWLCHTLLRGISDGIVVRCIDHLFGIIKHKGTNISHDEAVILIEGLSLFHERNAGDALLLFDHMMQVTNVTSELVEQCPSSCPWIDTVKELVISTGCQAEMASEKCDQQIVLSPIPSNAKLYPHEVSPSIPVEKSEAPLQDIEDINKADDGVNHIESAVNEEILTVATLSPETAPIMATSTSETRISLPEGEAVSSIVLEARHDLSVSKNLETLQLTNASINMPSSPITNVANETEDDIAYSSPKQNRRYQQEASPVTNIQQRNHCDNMPTALPRSNITVEKGSNTYCVLPDETIDTQMPVTSDTADDTQRCHAIPDIVVLPRDETIDLEVSPAKLPIEVKHSNVESASVTLCEPLNAEDDEEDYGHYPDAILENNNCQCTINLQPSNKMTSAVTTSIDVDTDSSTAKTAAKKKKLLDIGIQTSPSFVNETNAPPSQFSQLDVKGCVSQEDALAEHVGNIDSGHHRSYASSVVAESARSSISRILSQHIHSGASQPIAESTALTERYMQLVEVILSDCSYIANICLLSNYQDYRTLLPSFYDDGMVDNCTERVKRILDNLTMFPDQHITHVLSPVLLDACHISILHLCKEMENFPQISKLADKVIEVIVHLIDLFSIASGQLDGRSLLLFCAVVIHCLALPKYCFHRNIRLYNGLSRLISINALEQSTDILARLLVICLELSVQSLRRGDGGRILLAMLRLTKILQSQILNHLKVHGSMSPVARSELCKSHYTYMALLREYICGSTYKSTLESRLNDALHQAQVLVRSLGEII